MSRLGKLKIGGIPGFPDNRRILRLIPQETRWHPLGRCAPTRRNRDRLLEVAVRILSQDGPDVTLKAIAKDAGAGRTGA
jgi:AcrR family transcriptional regulator